MPDEPHSDGNRPFELWQGQSRIVLLPTMAVVLGLLAVASGFTAAAFYGGFHASIVIAGYLFVASAAVAWYTASAMMLRGAYGRVILPLGEPGGAKTNIPGRVPNHPIQYRGGMPGATIGR